MADQIDVESTTTPRGREAMICWRQLDRALWAGRLLDRPAGTIERDRRFVFVDLDGERHGGYSSLHDAKAAAERSDEPWPPPRRMGWPASSRVSTVGLAGLATSLLAAMVAIMAQRISF